ncbi:proteoglycan Cow [Leptopilina boulardi]|uniref:proteoglycan Cow n=1 Tax=Leptopilina boulardi TaxID=63433 RepID=UPI0021F599F9|nr:proteoglycan Cow [Leptopilina boulardi]
MRLSSLLFTIITLLIAITIATKTKRKFDGDFEFADEDDTRIVKSGDKKRWIYDPNSELCRPLNCKKKEICLLADSFTAVCVSKKELHKSGDVVIPKSRVLQERRMRTESSEDTEDDDDAFFDSEDDEEDQDESKCQDCPVVKPSFICGSDNRTYSSLCRIEYHNCIHRTYVYLGCKGFCPCKESVHPLPSHLKKMQKLQLQKQSLLGKMNRDRDITLTPRDFNYDNHHYKYLKYSKRAKALASMKRYDDKQFTSNEITEKTSLPPLKPAYDMDFTKDEDCSPASKPAMANRLLDWFSVLMTDAKQHRRPFSKPKGHFPPGCQSEVRWMFGHLDSDSSGLISLSELYQLEHDQNEPCLKPFFDSCDTDGDIFISGPEWCGCFSKAERPCAAVRKRLAPDVAPTCDSRGYYKNVQCHRGLGLCWCVDLHGVEFAGTRVHGTKPDCDAIINKINNGGLKTNGVDLDDDEDSIQDLEGSADQTLDF